MRHVTKTSANRMALSSLLLLLALGAAHADPRDIAPPPPVLTPEEREARRVQHLADMDAWLRMLEGRFRIEGIMQNRPVTGKADCISVGAGAGIQCVMYVTWDAERDAAGRYDLNEVPSLAPAMFQFGLDPAADRIRVLKVDNRSLSEPGTGILKGSTTRIQARCANTGAYPPCEVQTRIYVPQDAGYIHISIGTDTGSGSIQMSVDIESAVFGDGMENPFPSVMDSVGGAGDNLYLYPVARDATDEEFNQPYRRPPGSGVQWPDIPLRPRSAP